MAAKPRKPRITLKDVARETGFHFTTVSLALRGHESIPEKTRRKIAAAADALGYKKDPVFSVLSRYRGRGGKQSRSPKIAYVTNYGYDDKNRPTAYYEAIWKGAVAQANQLGYSLEHLKVGVDDHDSTSLEHHLQEHEIAGVIIAAFQPGFAELAINWRNYAIAKINSSHMEPWAKSVANDHLRDVRLAFRRLTRLGYDRVGLAISQAYDDGCRRRHTAGYLLEEASVPEQQRVPPLLFPYNCRVEEAAGMLGRWVRRHRVAAVMSDWINIKDMLEMEAMRVPDDVACACLCLTNSHSETTGVRPNLEMVGQRAVSLIATQLKVGEHGVPAFASATYVQSEWNEGATAPARNA